MSRRAGVRPLILTEEDEARFWSNVALPNEQGCMLWLGYIRADDGYGMFYLNGVQVLAHRVAYTVRHGPIPPDAVLDHVRAKGCTNHHCAADDHLEAVTQGENTRRGDAGANMREKTNCPAGHAYAGDNLYTRPDGGRTCRTCKRKHQATYWLRKRAVVATAKQ